MSETVDRVLARPVVGDGAVVHLWWRGGGEVVDVYVDGVLVERVEGGEVWLLVDRGFAHEVVVEHHPGRVVLGSAKPQAAGSAQAAGVGLVRDEGLAVDALLVVAVDGAEVEAGALWPAQVGRGGFGALFGQGSFGADDAAGPGLGEGELGVGPLGSDGVAFRWRAEQLAAGGHEVTLRVTDGRGVAIAEPAMVPIVVDAPPPAATQLSVEPEFTLTWRA